MSEETADERDPVADPVREDWETAKKVLGYISSSDPMVKVNLAILTIAVGMERRAQKRK